MLTQKQPKWWTQEHDSAWDRIKDAFKRDWDQTKHDFGGDEPDTEQHVSDTVGQAMGSNPIPPRGVMSEEGAEYAYRFGYGARLKYGKDHPSWDEEMEERLAADYLSANPDSDNEWEEQRDLVRAGWALEARPV